METIRKIRCAYHRDRKSFRQIAREFKLSRNTVKKVIRSEATEFTYDRKKAQPFPRLAPYQELLSEYLDADAIKLPREQRTAIVLFEELQRQGFEGGYDSVRRYVQKWHRDKGSRQITAYIPQTFDPGEAFQFDWSYEQVELAGGIFKDTQGGGFFGQEADLLLTICMADAKQNDKAGADGGNDLPVNGHSARFHSLQ